MASQLPHAPDPGRDASASPNRRVTAILSKAPVAGRVKTRLTPPLSPEEAAGLAEAMLRDAVERCARSTSFRTVLLHAPASASDWFAGAFREIEDLRPQRGAGLAERLANAFEELLADPEVETAVAIGSDQPLVGSAVISAAHEALAAGCDVVLGPDAGGGYYLVGLTRPHPELFTEVEMSTSGMCAATVRLAEARGLSVQELPPGYDVDVGADLVRLRTDLGAWRALGGSAEPDFPTHTDRFLSTLPVDVTP